MAPPPRFFFFYLDQGLSVNLKLTDSARLVAGPWAPGIRLSLPLLCWDYTSIPNTSGTVGDPDVGPDASVAST